MTLFSRLWLTTILIRRAAYACAKRSRISTNLPSTGLSTLRLKFWSPVVPTKVLSPLQCFPPSPIHPLSGQYSVFTAFLEQGDEVIMFEPFFDQYLPSVTFNGGKPVYVPLHPNLSGEKPNSSDWTIDFDELRCVKFTPPFFLVSNHFLAALSPLALR